MITLITPAYNVEKTILKLYENLKPLICNDIKWIIVNDKSIDNTKAIITEIKKENTNITSFDLKENNGPQYARYYGILKSNTDLIFLLDADDFIYEKNFKAFLEFIQKSPKYDFYFSIIHSVNREELFSSNTKFEENKIIEIKQPTDFIVHSFPHPSSLVINRNFYLDIYKECNLTWGEDIYMYLLLSQYGNGVRWIYPVSCYINNGSGRGSKISLNSRLKLSASLFKQSLAIKK
ncbi:glycosyltransferase family 2 protein [Escherichia coli]|nr:glycosyltransferase family 2 protein [Escherichia coli]MCH4702919.1 glycosyltransferase [Escherichia coli]